MSYLSFFRKASEISTQPYPYQERMAAEAWPDLLDVPTGMGKTAVMAIWMVALAVKIWLVLDGDAE